MELNLKNSKIYITKTECLYYNSILTVLKSILKNIEIDININFSTENYNFNNNNKTLKIAINYEHTLVKQGGRTSNNAPIGIIQDENSNPYLVRIDKFTELNQSDIVIDYSIPNIYNINASQLFTIFSNKLLYIYPSLYESYFITTNRNINTLTTFINTNEQRRFAFLNNIANQNINHININNCWGKNELQNLYKNTKILINIHQTDHHDTFEELRCLPALQCGVIVISENSALYELIPYHDYIIWTSYGNMIEKTKEVIENYDSYYNEIFVKLKNKLLHEFDNENYQNLYNKIIKPLKI